MFHWFNAFNPFVFYGEIPTLSVLVNPKPARVCPRYRGLGIKVLVEESAAEKPRMGKHQWVCLRAILSAEK